VLGVYLGGGVDRLHREDGKHSGWQQRRIDVAEDVLNFGPQGSPRNSIR
jgi:hypothetical protein